jgi:hypothetical protein
LEYGEAAVKKKDFVLNFLKQYLVQINPSLTTKREKKNSLKPPASQKSLILPTAKFT